MAKFMHGWVNQQILIWGTKIIYGWGGVSEKVPPPPHTNFLKNLKAYKEIVKQGHLRSKVIVPNESPNMISY